LTVIITEDQFLYIYLSIVLFLFAYLPTEITRKPTEKIQNDQIIMFIRIKHLLICSIEFKHYFHALC